MAQVLQLRRGTTAQNDAFTGAIAEVSVDTDKNYIRVHDGVTMGGHELGDVFPATLPAAASVAGSDQVLIRQGGVTKQATKTLVLNGIVNANIDAAAAIVDTKLATISTALKVSNSATTATSANTASAIVARDASNNFSAGTITANLTGNASGSAGTLATSRTISLTGDVTGTTAAFNGSTDVSAATTIANDAVTTAKILNDNVVTAKIADSNVTAAKLAFDTGAMSGFRNRIINGDFRVAQLSTQYTDGTVVTPNDDDSYTLDRWILLSNGNDRADVTQELADVPAGSAAAMRLQFVANTAGKGILQIIENQNCSDLIGSTATLSFKAKVTDSGVVSDVRAAIVSWSGTSDDVTSDIVATWNTSPTNPSLIANATYENTPANLNVTNSWASYSVTAAIDTASTKNVMVFIWNNDGSTDGESLYVTDVQLELGSRVTPFERRPIGAEIDLCSRYLAAFSGETTLTFPNDVPGFPGRATSTTVARASVLFSTPLRARPTSVGLVSYQGDPAMVVQRGAATTIQVVTGPTFVGASRSGAIFTVAVASGLTQNEPLTVCLEGLSVLSSVPVLFWRAEL
jgi:hypothetical protein